MKRLSLLLAGIFVPIMMFADIVTEQEAFEKAKQFMPDKSFVKNQTPKRALVRDGEAPKPAYYYIFNAENDNGFVIISADDRTESILGYADNGYFDQDNLPSNVKAWFEFYEQSIRSLGDAPAQAPQHRASRAAIEPLIKTKWNQSYPYNLQCPMDGEERSITGCIATAIAQVMFYHKWPAATSQDIPAYTTATKAIDVEALPATTFKWNLMKYEYQNDAVGDTANAVAELMRYCGQISLMDYTSEESGAYYEIENLIEYFNYSGNTRTAARSQYSNIQWEDLIYNELVKNRPVLYRGNPTYGTGHAFICDGYDGNGLYHINWGWGGHYDGFFSLSILNPSGRGAGGGSSSEGYCDNQKAIVGFAPASEHEKLIPTFQSENVTIITTNHERTSTDLDFESIELSGGIYAYYSVTPQVELNIETGWILYKNDTFDKCIGYDTQTVSLSKESHLTNNKTVSFGSDLEDGQYSIYQAYRLSGETEWILCENSIRECIVANISGNSMTLQKNSLYSDITVNSIVQSGTAIKGHDSKVVVNITNNGTTFQQQIPLEARKQGLMGSVKSYATTYLNPGETSDVILSFTPISSGIYVVTVGDVTIEIPVIESILTISDFSTSIQPMLNVPFNLSFNVTYWGNDSRKYNYYKIWTKQDGEESWTEGDWYAIMDMAAGVPVEQSLSFTPTVPGTFQIRFTNYEGTEELATFSITVINVELETIEGITYACDNETHYATVISSDEKVFPSDLVIPSSITHNSVEYYVKTIGEYAFYVEEGNCGKIKTLKISEGIETICMGAFFGCYNIRTLDLPSTIKRIDKYAFYGSGKKYIIIRMQNTFDIDESVFGEYSTPTLYVPVGTKSDYQKCQGWKKFKNILEGSIRETTIDGISYLAHFPSMEAKVTKYDAQEEDYLKITIPASIIIDDKSYQVTSIEAKISNKVDYTIQHLILSEGIKTICSNAFANNRGLTRVELPSTLTFIGDSAFYGCKLLQTVLSHIKTPCTIGKDVIDQSKTDLLVPVGTKDLYKSTDGWKEFNLIFDIIPTGQIKEKTDLGITYTYGTESKTAIISKAINYFLTPIVPSKVTIEGTEYSVVAIDEEAYIEGFTSTFRTDNVIIQEGIRYIGAKAFNNCYFRTLELPSTLERIGNQAFYSHGYLNYVTVKTETPPVSDNDIFVGSNNIDTIFVPGGSLARYKAISAWNIATISDDVTITAKNTSITYGKSLPVFEYTSKGAPLVGVPYMTCSVTKTTPVGSYPIEIHRGTVLNTIKDSINGTLTVFKAGLKITAKSYTIKEGDSIPELGVTYQGFMNNEDSTVLSKLPTISTKATSSSAPGVYDITVSGAVAQNYGISYVKGKLIIESNTVISDIADDDKVSVYTLSGTMLYNSIDIKKVYDQLPSGIYIIRQKDQKTMKLIK